MPPKAFKRLEQISAGWSFRRKINLTRRNLGVLIPRPDILERNDRGTRSSRWRVTTLPKKRSTRMSSTKRDRTNSEGTPRFSVMSPTIWPKPLPSALSVRRKATRLRSRPNPTRWNCCWYSTRPFSIIARISTSRITRWRCSTWY